jgi:hypothetical protein
MQLLTAYLQLCDASETIENGGVERGGRLRVKPPRFRIAIASATNTAVDRVLEACRGAGLVVRGSYRKRRMGGVGKRRRKRGDGRGSERKRSRKREANEEEESGTRKEEENRGEEEVGSRRNEEGRSS